ncbi:MAG: hypothetical protein M3N46_03825 [Actinomycetota bacterium]|nr:hypothetical protein [Actinomycetota bacterium]
MTALRPETGVTASAAPVPGIVTISQKAMKQLFAAIAADELGVGAGEVSTTVTDRNGRLAIAVVGPIRSAPLGEPRTTSLLAGAEAVRQRVARDGASLSGADIDTVRLRITGTRVENDRRVA